MNEITQKICAEFNLDENNKPLFDESPRYKRKHYQIKIFIENAPEDTHAVTYELSESHIDPVQEVFKETQSFNRIQHIPNFELETTSYGDFEIKAKIRQKDYANFVSRRLSDALREKYGDTSNPDIQNAINDIEKY